MPDNTYPTTPDGRYFVVRGRLWRCSNPRLDAPTRLALVREFMTGRRDVRNAKQGKGVLAAARARVDSHERNWGFVDQVLRKPEEVHDFFAAQTYETKTRGTRHLAAARPAGEGVYALALRGAQVHLACRLELPKTPGPVQNAVGISTEAVYALSIKNPKAGGALLGEGKAHLPNACKPSSRDGASKVIPLRRSTMRASSSSSPV